LVGKIIDGKAIAAQVREQVGLEVAEMIKAVSAAGPGDSAGGENPASKVYVSSKQKACRRAGDAVFGYQLPATATQEEVERLVSELNADPHVMASW